MIDGRGHRPRNEFAADAAHLGLAVDPDRFPFELAEHVEPEPGVARVHRPARRAAPRRHRHQRRPGAAHQAAAPRPRRHRARRLRLVGGRLREAGARRSSSARCAGPSTSRTRSCSSATIRSPISRRRAAPAWRPLARAERVAALARRRALRDPCVAALEALCAEAPRDRRSRHEHDRRHARPRADRARHAALRRRRRGAARRAARRTSRALLPRRLGAAAQRPAPSPTPRTTRSSPASCPRRPSRAATAAGSRSASTAARRPAARTCVLDGATIVEGLAARGYHTLCVGGVGFFNLQNPLGNVLPGLFAESHWDRRDRRHRSALVREPGRRRRALARGAPVRSRRAFPFVNVSALHQPNRFYLAGAAAGDTRASHAAALGYVDRHVPRLFAALSRRGPVFAIVCSDHGTPTARTATSATASPTRSSGPCRTPRRPVTEGDRSSSPAAKRGRPP